MEVTWVAGRVDEFSLSAGWHGIRAPRSKSSGLTRPPVAVEPPARSQPYARGGELRLPGTSGDHHDDLFLQVYLPVSLDKNWFMHKTLNPFPCDCCVQASTRFADGFRYQFLSN